MFLFSSRVFRVALLPIALGIFVASANAQQAKFTLPFDTQWGSVVLPAGEYIMYSPMTLDWPKVLSISGQGKAAYILAGVEKLAPESEAGSYLRIANFGDKHVVREYRSALTGRTFLFDVPKALQSEIASRGHSQEITKIAVLTRH
jgi:hypothetical protein